MIVRSDNIVWNIVQNSTVTKMKKVFIIFVFLLLSCDNEAVLGNNYYYLTDYEALDVGYPHGSIVYKSDRINSFDDIVVYSDIEKCIYNSEYILISQIPNKSLMLGQLREDLEFWNAYFLKNGKNINVDLMYGEVSLNEINKLFLKPQDINEKVDSIFRNELFYRKIFRNKRNYYIIQKTNDSVFGPLTVEEFQEIKNKKNIDLDW